MGFQGLFCHLECIHNFSRHRSNAASWSVIVACTGLQLYDYMDRFQFDQEKYDDSCSRLQKVAVDILIY